MAKLSRGLIIRKWRQSQRPKVSIQNLGDATGNAGGWTISKFERGERVCLPIDLAVKISGHTGIPLERLLTAEQKRSARELFAVMARDAAA